MSDATNPLAVGDPEAAGAAATSTALLPAVASLLDARSANLSNALTSHYDPSRTLAENALDPGGMAQATSVALGFGPGVIRAWHGTPHTFPAEPGAPLGRFQDEAIGSGEGAQAYGWGHYVAGNKGVASSYAKPGDIDFRLNGKSYHSDELDSFPPEQSIGIGAWLKTGGDPDKAVASLKSDIANIPHDWQEDIDSHYNAIDWLTHNSHLLDKPPAGNLMEVHILPEENELLDWDKALSEQPPAVQNTLNSISDKIKSRGNEYLLPKAVENNHSGEIIYKALASDSQFKDIAEPVFNNKDWPSTDTHEMASKALHEAGVPGIKYADQGSRDAYQISQKGSEFTAFKRWPSQDLEEDFSPTFTSRQDVQDWIDKRTTRNYVIFSPSNLRIVGRNGERLIPVDHDPFASE